MPEGRSKLHERDAQTKRYGQNRCRWKGCDPSERQCAENCRYHRVRHHEAAYQFVTSPNWPEWAVERSPSTVTVPVEPAYWPMMTCPPAVAVPAVVDAGVVPEAGQLLRGPICGDFPVAGFGVPVEVVGSGWGAKSDAARRAAVPNARPLLTRSISEIRLSRKWKRGLYPVRTFGG